MSKIDATAGYLAVVNGDNLELVGIFNYDDGGDRTCLGASQDVAYFARVDWYGERVSDKISSGGDCNNPSVLPSGPHPGPHPPPPHPHPSPPPTNDNDYYYSGNKGQDYYYYNDYQFDDYYY